MSTKRKTEIPDTTFHKVIKWLCMILQAGIFVYLLIIWGRLPDTIPTHYNSAGEIDGYGSRWTIWITPVTMIFMFLFIGFIERHPDLWNTGVTVTRQNREKVYAVLKNMIVTLKLVLVLTFGYMSVWTTTGAELGNWFLPVTLLFTFGPMIYYLVLLVKVSKEF